MPNRVLLGPLLALLFSSMLAGTFHIEPVKASGTIYIRADGSIDPPTAPISTVDNVTYIFIDNINDSVVVERDSIIIDGNSSTLQGDGTGVGLGLEGRRGITVKKITIINFSVGIYMYSEYSYYGVCTIRDNTILNCNWAGIEVVGYNNNNIRGNIVTNTPYGIYLSGCDGNIVSNNYINGGGIYLNGGSDSNTISYNKIMNSADGIILMDNCGNNIISCNDVVDSWFYGFYVYLCFNNIIYHNNIINNDVQVYSEASVNIWDDGYPSGGNYWSDYAGVDFYSGPYQNETGRDGIGDTPYIIDATNTDRYPLRNPWPFRIVETTVNIAGTNYTIPIESNAAITHAVATKSALYFNTSGPTGTTGYINISFPMGLNKTEIKVFIDGVKLTPPPYPIITSNGTHYFIYFESTLSVHDTIVQYAIVDIATTNVTPHKTVVGQGYCTSINVTVENQGNYTETFKVFAYYDELVIPTPSQWDTFWSMGDVNRDGFIDMEDYALLEAAWGSYPGHPRWDPRCDLNQDGHVGPVDLGIYGANYGRNIWTYFGLGTPPIGTKIVTNLPNGTSTTITFTWNTTGFAKGNYTISAYAEPVPGETDTEDNLFTGGLVKIGIPGDINGDTVVDSTDLGILGGAWGSYKGDLIYNPNTDIDGDGVVDSSDLGIMGAHWGETE